MDRGLFDVMVVFIVGMFAMGLAIHVLNSVIEMLDSLGEFGAVVSLVFGMIFIFLFSHMM